MQLSSFMVKGGSILLIIYAVFLLGRSIWTNYDLRQSIRKLNDQISTLEQQKKGLSDLNIYYQSDSYKELEARRKLNMKMPDEKVVIITGVSSSSNFSDQLAQDQSSLGVQSEKASSPNWMLWLDFFTKPTGR